MTQTTSTFTADDSLADDFQDYCRKLGADAVSYAEWLGMKREWAHLSAAYDREIEPFYIALKPGFDLDEKVKRRQHQLLRDMDYLETLLGY